MYYIYYILYILYIDIAKKWLSEYRCWLHTGHTREDFVVLTHWKTMLPAPCCRHHDSIFHADTLSWYWANLLMPGTRLGSNNDLSSFVWLPSLQLKPASALNVRFQIHGMRMRIQRRDVSFAPNLWRNIKVLGQLYSIWIRTDWFRDLYTCCICICVLNSILTFTLGQRHHSVFTCFSNFCCIRIPCIWNLGCSLADSTTVSGT